MKHPAKTPFRKTLSLLAAAMLAAGSSGAQATWYVNDNSLTGDAYTSTTGSDVLGSGSSAAPYLTIGKAISVASANDTIKVDAGTYMEHFTLNKALALLGVRRGVDARTRSGAESIVDGAGYSPVYVTAGTVTVDGFTIQNATTNGNAFPNSYGILLSTGISGSRVLNNIVQNNVVGMALANAGAAQVVIQQNLFRNNNISGSGSGNAIYTDQFVSGPTLSNFLIADNNFVGQSRGLILTASPISAPTFTISSGTISGNSFDGTPTASQTLVLLGGASSLTISGNTFPNGRFALLSGLTNSTVSNNQFTGTTGTGVALTLASGSGGTLSNNISVTGNSFINRVGSAFAASNGGVSNLTFSGNTVTQNLALLSGSKFFVDLNGLAGTSSISSNTFTFSGTLSTAANVQAIDIRQSAGTTGTVNVSQNVISASGSTITGATQSNGLQIQQSLAAASVVNITNNFINAFQNGVDVAQQANAGTAIAIHENDLTGNTLKSIKAGAGGTVIDATCNWFGTTDASTIATLVSGNATYTPYLTNGTDNSATIGFQPVPHTISLSSPAGTNAQSVCVNTPIVNITYTTTGATGASFSGLPTGVAGSWAANVVTISGTPSIVGIFNYTVTTTGCAGSVLANGTITSFANNVTASAVASPLYPMAGQETQTIYLNYPSSAQVDTIKVTPSGGSSPYSYFWQKSNCNGAIMDTLKSGGVPVTASKYAFLPTNADTCSYFGDNVYTFIINVTDAIGCTTITSVTKKLNVVNPWAGNAGTSNVQICHHVPRSSLTQILQVSPSLVASHLGHGDILGNCPVFIGKQILPGEEGGEEIPTAYLYPNPTTGVFMLELSEITEQANITVTDISGKVIKNQTMNKDGVRTATFDMSSYAKGIYLIQVVDGPFIYRDKIVVQ